MFSSSYIAFPNNISIYHNIVIITFAIRIYEYFQINFANSQRDHVSKYNDGLQLQLHLNFEMQMAI